jgi:hypothetical protein
MSVDTSVLYVQFENSATAKWRSAENWKLKDSLQRINGIFPQFAMNQESLHKVMLLLHVFARQYLQPKEDPAHNVWEVR